jgi:aryl-alcohol dehydrogenase-like predicted oxidoreductase
VQYRSLGRTGMRVSAVGFGAWAIGSAWGPVDDRESLRALEAALDAGVNFIDTADSYAGGESESRLGQVLKGRRHDVVLASKLHNRMGPGPNEVGQSRIHIAHALEDSLRRLDTDHIDLYQIHSFDPVTPMEEMLGALDDAVRQGKVRYIGCSNLAAWQVMKALGISAQRNLEAFVSVQAYYSLAGRDLEADLLPMILDQQLGLTIWSPLAGGLLSGKFTRHGATESDARRAQMDFPPVALERTYDIIDVLTAVGARHEVSAARVALAWILARPGVTSVIVGARRLEQLTDNLAAVDLALTEEDLSELDAVSDVPPSYPGWLQSYTNAERWPSTTPEQP